LADNYARFFHHNEYAQLLIILSEYLNFVDSEEDFALLLRQIEQMRGPREYFNFGR
jgi:hypothetical protein